LGKKTYRNKGKKANIVISIAGAHGVGKTTVFNMLKKKYYDNNKFKFFPERYIKNPPFPFGSTDKNIGFRSEIHFLQQLIRRNKNIINFDSTYNGRIIILDRTPICVLIYSKGLNLKSKDYDLILNTYTSVDWREDYVIYLTAEPETILKRIQQRGSLESVRKEWNEHKREYLLKILEYYDEFLISRNNKTKIFVINTEHLLKEELIKKIEELIAELTGYSFKKIDKPPSTQLTLNKFLSET
jgi:deoxyadenosine/deoxycytidine kinase